MSAPSVAIESSRQQALDSFRILDTQPEPVYDEVVLLASHICGTPVALVSLVDRERLYFKARAGLDVEQVPRQRSLCDYAIQSPHELLEVCDAGTDPRFADTPLVIGAPGIRFYAGVPLVTSDGMAIGTLCVIDREPRTLDDRQRTALRSLARLTVELLESRRRALTQIRHGAGRQFSRRRGDRHGTGQDAERLADAMAQRRSAAGNHHVADSLAGDDNLAVAIIEIDDFARLCAEHGQAICDEVLHRVTQTIEACLHVDDEVSRYGGQELLLILADGARAPALLDEIRDRLQALEPPYGVTVSSGVAFGSGGTNAIMELFERADQALQFARSAGRNRVMFA